VSQHFRFQETPIRRKYQLTINSEIVGIRTVNKLAVINSLVNAALDGVLIKLVKVCSPTADKSNNTRYMNVEEIWDRHIERLFIVFEHRALSA